MTSSQAIDQMRLVLRRQHKALSTEKSYLFWLRRYIEAVFLMPSLLSCEQKVERFLSDLARDRDVSASTQNQAFNAVLFFYRDVLGRTLGNVNALRAQRPVHERRAPTVAETQSLLSTIGNEGGYPTNLISRLLYGCGLRVSEPLNLRVKDVDLERRTLCIRGAKGGKDRVVPLPTCVIPELTQQIAVARAVWQRDQQDRTPLMLPNRLARKYPAYQFHWGWAWVFPAHHPCQDPRTETVVRFRMHEANVQRAVKKASRQLGISVLPHEMRHAYASHCLARGTNPRAIQQVMGHSSLETTMGYFHAEALSVSSPLDALPVALPGPEALSGIGRAAEPIDPKAQRPCQSPHTLNSSNMPSTKRFTGSIPVRPMLRPPGGPMTYRASTLSTRQAVGSSVRPPGSNTRHHCPSDGTSVHQKLDRQGGSIDRK